MRFSWMIILMFAVGVAAAQDTNFPTGPQYLLIGSPLFARPISTPTLSLAQMDAPLEVGASNATANLVPGADNETFAVLPQPFQPPNLLPIYYGVPETNVIEISFRENEEETELPASILGTGTVDTTTAQALRERGYGVTLGEAAAFSKSHIRKSRRVYTNQDIERLHGS